MEKDLFSDEEKEALKALEKDFEKYDPDYKKKPSTARNEYNKTKQKLYRLQATLLNNEFLYFLTLTMKNDLDKDKFVLSVKRWLKDNIYGYCGVVEFQKNGNPHFHLMLTDLPFDVVPEKAMKGWKKGTYYIPSFYEKWGMNELKYVDNYFSESYSHLVLYMSKYLTKDNVAVFYSKGLKKYLEVTTTDYDSLTNITSVKHLKNPYMTYGGLMSLSEYRTLKDFDLI